jgi:hypothetical protein
MSVFFFGFHVATWMFRATVRDLCALNNQILAKLKEIESRTSEE